VGLKSLANLLRFETAQLCSIDPKLNIHPYTAPSLLKPGDLPSTGTSSLSGQ
jgi:hypothetical protein